MKILAILFSLLFLASSSFSATGKVIKVSDGDTITVLQNNRSTMKVRLYGIDAPEKKQEFGQKARSELSHLIAGKVVEIEDCGKDRYGRIVGLVKYKGVNINREMLKRGFAWVYDAFCKKPFCREWKNLEGQARRARAGLWRDKQPIPPWQWRKRSKTKK